MRILDNIYHTIRTTPVMGRMAIGAIPDLQWTINVQDIGPMQINLRRNRNYWLRDPIEHEKFILGVMQKLVRPGDVVFDAGANIGLHVRFLVQCFGAKVIAFEPISENVALLTRNVQLGNCGDNVQVIPVALADFDGEDVFQVDDLSSASGSLNVITGGEPCQARKQYGLAPLTKKVVVAQFDTLMERYDLPAPNVIKVDVEGAEERLLRGAIGILQRYGPYLVIELHGAEAARAVVRLLADLQYHVFGYLSTRNGTIYREIGIRDLDEISDQYSLHFCAAGRDRSMLETHADYRKVT
jgi:FkbM family methyltransferase